MTPDFCRFMTLRRARHAQPGESVLTAISSAATARHEYFVLAGRTDGRNGDQASRAAIPTRGRTASRPLRRGARRQAVGDNNVAARTIAMLRVA